VTLGGRQWVRFLITSRICQWTQPFVPQYGAAVYSAAIRNEYQKIFLGIKRGWDVRLTNEPHGVKIPEDAILQNLLLNIILGVFATASPSSSKQLLSVVRIARDSLHGADPVMRGERLRDNADIPDISLTSRLH
jgi:hypothetical protein